MKPESIFSGGRYYQHLSAPERVSCWAGERERWGGRGKGMRTLGEG